MARLFSARNKMCHGHMNGGFRLYAVVIQFLVIIDSVRPKAVLLRLQTGYLKAAIRLNSSVDNADSNFLNDGR